MYQKEGESSAREWPSIVKDLLEFGLPASPREMNTKEFYPAVLTFRNPRENYINPPGRDLPLPFGMAETLDFMFNPKPTGVAYNKQVARFINPVTGTYYGYYYDRLKIVGLHQFHRIYDTLRDQKDTRRAVAIVHNPVQESYESPDIACTISLSYLIRDDKLHAITNMRSNDARIGLCLDTFTFQFYQQLFAADLEVGLGSYTHITNSLHLYESDVPLVQNIIKQLPADNVYDHYKPIPLEKDTYYRLQSDLKNVNNINLRCVKPGDDQAERVTGAIQMLDLIRQPLLVQWGRVFIGEWYRRLKMFDKSDEIADKIENEYKDYFIQKRSKREASQ